MQHEGDAPYEAGSEDRHGVFPEILRNDAGMLQQSVPDHMDAIRLTGLGHAPKKLGQAGDGGGNSGADDLKSRQTEQTKDQDTIEDDVQDHGEGADPGGNIGMVGVFQRGQVDL